MKLWLQIQADVFNANMVKLASEQDTGMDAAMLAACGCGWFSSLDVCAEQFLQEATVYTPNPDRVKTYQELFGIYQEIYQNTREMNQRLKKFRG